MAERREHFPEQAYRFLDGKLHDVRILVMRVAADLARDELPQTEVYTVRPRLVEAAWNMVVAVNDGGKTDGG